jgi:hypothetical protein
MILEDRKTVRITFCMLGKSGEAVHVRDDVEDEDEEEEDDVEEGRIVRLE